MALFKKKETTEKSSKKAKPTEAKVEVVAQTALVSVGDSRAEKGVKGKALTTAQVIVRPHVTEKATDLSDRGVYAFEVNMRANKASVRNAIAVLFKVTPVKIAIINEPAKYTKNPRTNRRALKQQAMKKALVYLKKGDKIEFV